MCKEIISLVAARVSNYIARGQEREKTYVQASERGDIEKSAVRNEVGMSMQFWLKLKGRNYGPMEETYYS